MYFSYVSYRPHIFNLKSFHLPKIWLSTVLPSSPKQALLASNGFVNCTKAYPLCIDIPAKQRTLARARYKKSYKYSKQQLFAV